MIGNLLFFVLLVTCWAGYCNPQVYEYEYKAYGCQDLEPLMDELYEMRGRTKADCEFVEFDGVLNIYPFGSGTRSKSVYCDASTTGGRWMVVQARREGVEDFYKTWEEYEFGFGNASFEHWVGLETLHELTKRRDYVLRVEVADAKGEMRFAEYSVFKIGSRQDRYRLTIAGYSGNAGDSLAYHNEMPFSTFDRENDPEMFRNCAKRYRGAWWYKTCYQSNLNGAFGAPSIDGIRWNKWKLESLVQTKMMIRRVRY